VCKGGRDLYRASGEPSTVAAADDAGARQLALTPLSRPRATLRPASKRVARCPLEQLGRQLRAQVSAISCLSWRRFS
jgi:hypothetical protein